MLRFLLRPSSLLSTALLGVVLLLGGCDSLTELDAVTVDGRVIDQNGDPVQNALVDLVANQFVRQTRTDSVGAYKFDFEISDAVQQTQQQQQTQPQEAVTVSIEASFGSAVSTPVTKLVSSGQSYTMRDLQITISETTGGDDGSDDGTDDGTAAASITFDTRSAQQVSVSGVGGSEIGKLIFVVYDANGNPVTSSNASTVRVRIDAAPDGEGADGSFIFPEEAVTDSDGKVEFTFTSGTVAGTAQVVAEVVGAVNPAGNPVRTAPVTLVVHGGLPDANHFSVVNATPNFGPALPQSGLTNAVTAFVGDKYGNPVEDGTQVYFTTDQGLVVGSAPTVQGVAQVDLISADPRLDRGGPGTIRARTSNENQEVIETTTRVLFTGYPIVSLLNRQEQEFVVSGDATGATNAFDNVPDGVADTVFVNSVRFDYRVADRNTNPLSAGTTISVSSEGENIEQAGNVSAEIARHVIEYGPINGVTDFSFSVFIDDLSSETLPIHIESKVTVNGPNGSGTASFPGFGPMRRLEDR
ncbi:MAG: hypothetical protein AAGG50_03365 [Bacteroidota bacterium]